MTALKNIRNFALIAHIDHGKSSLADWLIRLCGGLEEREMRSQVLDKMDIERERGITIKAQTARLSYKGYQLNMIDTPGHVDFSYEVSRSLSACEGSILIVDASQGVQAQTLANVYQALEHNHEILLVLNKTDLPAADPERIKGQIEEMIGLDTQDALLISAKTGMNVEAVLEGVIGKLPPPQGERDDVLKALLIDSWYDPYVGIVILIRVFNGQIRVKESIRFMSTGRVYEVDQVGIFTPKARLTGTLSAGEVGFITAGIRAIDETRVGDTITRDKQSAIRPLAGFKPSRPVVFCSLFASEAQEFEKLRDSLGKLSLNDSSVVYEPEASSSLGFGFRCGFLGLLHLEIVEERLRREFDLELVSTAPSVVYKLELTDGSWIDLHNPADMPEKTKIKEIQEPWIKATILAPQEYLGDILLLCEERRGRQIDLGYASNRVVIEYHLPLNEIVFDFYDRLKSISRGHASFDYTLEGYKIGDLVKVSIRINGESADSLAYIVPRGRAESRGRQLCLRLKELIPRQLFAVAIQAVIEGRVIARETVSALRKDVLAKCYGGDVTRKRKLLEKQKKGKKRMRQFGQVSIPQNVFIEVLKRK